MHLSTLRSALAGLAGLFVFFFLRPAEATPRMSLTAGTPCSGCHYTPSGSGGRTELGWSSMNHVGALTYDQLGLKGLHDVDSNTWLDGKLSVGIDFRVQAARLGQPEVVDLPTGGTETTYPDITVFPMQVQPYVAVQPTKDLTLYGSFAPGPEVCADPVFPGMSCYLAWGMYSFGAGKPFIRAGMLQPTIGIRHDDHTILIRGDAANRRTPVIPPNFAELGAEIGSQPLRWLRVESGVFHNGNLDDALNGNAETTDLWPVSVSARVTFLPQFEFGGSAPAAPADEFDDFDAEPVPATPPVVLNSWFGVSGFASGDFLMVNGFMGLGLPQGLAFFAETAYSARTIQQDVLNGFVGLQYALKDWFVLSARAERAQTTTATEEEVLWQYVAGVEFFPIPFMEIRPEYRLVENDRYRFGQATVQLHLFY